ncbi:CCR4-NOT transcription complex subunit 2 [Rhipicephalus sanguineus]|uniref:CCR4-NOT transcription complex subunit 2 n=1 Tax=Rhipicephalus sanguineus TaxID=34632 RepID=UPI001894FDAF|nr:CCR4-NOT transcription complex subunit 2 [Rhipicephalus sanguineus]
MTSSPSQPFGYGQPTGSSLIPFFPSVSQQQQPGVLPGGGGSRGAPFPDMFGADKATSSSSFGDLGLRGTLGGALSQFPPSVARPPPTSLSGFPPASLPPPQQASPNSRTMLTIGSRALPGQRQVGPDINRLVGLGAPPRTGYTDQSSLWRNNVPASGGGISSFGMSHSSRNFPSSQSLMGNSLQSQLFNSNPALDLSEFPSLTNRGSQEGSAQSLSSNPMAGRAAYGKLFGMVKQPNNDSNEFHIHNEDFPALPGSQGQENNQDSLSKQTSNASSESSKDGSGFSSDKVTSQPVKRGIQTSKDGTVTNIPAGMVTDQYGMVGLLTFIRAAETDPNLVSLALGSDLTTLGLNLNSPENLYPVFGGPWAEQPCRPQDIDYHVPSEYIINQSIRDKLAGIKLNRYGEDLLFFIFYMFGGDLLQLLSASELYNRDWRFHKDERVWITRAGISPTEKTSTYERGTYFFFDPVNWRKVAKEFHLDYDRLEDRPQQYPPL